MPRNADAVPAMLGNSLSAPAVALAPIIVTNNIITTTDPIRAARGTPSAPGEKDEDTAAKGESR